MVVLRFCFVFVAVTCIMAQTGTKRKRESVLDYFRVSTFVSDTEGAGTNATNKETHFPLVESHAVCVNMSQTIRFLSRTCWLFDANLQLIWEKPKGLFC